MANAAGEKESAKASATEQPAKKTFQALEELTPQSGSIGTWLLAIVDEPRQWEYEYSYNGRKIKGKRFEVILVGSDPGVYCIGAFRRKTDSPAGNRRFVEGLGQFKRSSIWEASKIAIAKEKPCFISSPLKLMIDLGASQMTPVLQGLHKMPSEVTPLDTLHTILECPPHQRVDVTALVHEVAVARDASTSHGPRLIFDITIRDDSGPDKTSESKFTIFLPQGEKSRKAYEELQQMREHKTPVTFFALQCDMEGSKKIMKPDFERFRWQVCHSGSRREQLMKKTAEVLDPTAKVTVISEIPDFEPREAQDYINVPALHTTCEILAAALRSGVALMAKREGDGPILFQINHARICEPSGSDNLLTSNQDRLFPLTTVYDRTGRVEVRMREKVALNLSGQASKDEFLNDFSSGELNYPILCSVRVLVKQNSAEDHSEDLSAIIMEAEPQKLDPEAAPNKSSLELDKLMSLLPPSTERMMVAPVAAISHAPHGGMVVEVNGKRHQCSCVLSFIAHTGKSHLASLENGQRLTSKEIWNIPFTGTPEDRDNSAPEHADKKIAGVFASFCTCNNVQYYTLSPTCGKEPVYAIVVISNVIKGKDGMMYMIDKVAKIEMPGQQMEVIQHFKKLAWPLGVNDSEQPRRTSRTFSPSSRETPYSVRKSRRLSFGPSDASLPSPGKQSASPF